jgi:hypothetical protein
VDRVATGFSQKTGIPARAPSPHEVGVRRGRRRDDDPVDAPFQYVGGRSGDPGTERLPHLAREVGHGVGDDELLDRRKIRECLPVERADAPHPDKSDPHGPRPP